MKKQYMSPEIDVVDLAFKDNLLIQYSNTEAPINADVYAPGMLNDDEIFQLFLIH